MSNLHILKERIEQMSKGHQVDVLRLLSKNEGVTFNENNNGTFVNLTCQSAAVIQQLEQYVTYVNDQQKNLNAVESEKVRIEQTFFCTK